MKNRIRLKRIQGKKRIKKWNLEHLDREQISQFQEDIDRHIDQREGSEMEKVNDRWNALKNDILQSAETNIGYKKGRTPKKPWVTPEMLHKMDERRKWKGVNSVKGRKQYRKLNNELRRETENARQEWWKDQCSELEDLERKGK